MVVVVAGVVAVEAVVVVEVVEDPMFSVRSVRNLVMMRVSVTIATLPLFNHHGRWLRLVLQVGISGSILGTVLNHIHLLIHHQVFSLPLVLFLQELGKPQAYLTGSDAQTSQASQLWYPDSGATHHVTNTNNSENLLDSISLSGSDQVLLGNGQGQF
ncbi:uncharacterized protein LOC123906731 [Trifolium pratense]|uniref:uncharacterized protein LOC123906731 n=1 Tax=Trifolium pratense TaxID=57577 RepID=UPI001E6903F3|nr:uncharacterized protein LOC123906731 [Trifolium pratense]